MDEHDNTSLSDALAAAAERILATQPTLYIADDGQRWLMPPDIIEGCQAMERMTDSAEQYGHDAGWNWALTSGSVGDLERFAAGTVDLWRNETDHAIMGPLMQSYGVPMQLADAFLHGFICGAMTAWEQIKPLVLAAMEETT